MNSLRLTMIAALCALATASTTAPLLDIERSNISTIVATTTSTVPPDELGTAPQMDVGRSSEGGVPTDVSVATTTTESADQAETIPPTDVSEASDSSLATVATTTATTAVTTTATTDVATTATTDVTVAATTDVTTTSSAPPNQPETTTPPASGEPSDADLTAETLATTAPSD